MLLVAVQWKCFTLVATQWRLRHLEQGLSKVGHISVCWWDKLIWKRSSLSSCLSDWLHQLRFADTCFILARTHRHAHKHTCAKWFFATVLLLFKPRGTFSAEICWKVLKKGPPVRLDLHELCWKRLSAAGKKYLFSSDSFHSQGTHNIIDNNNFLSAKAKAWMHTCGYVCEWFLSNFPFVKSNQGQRVLKWLLSLWGQKGRWRMHESRRHHRHRASKVI